MGTIAVHHERLDILLSEGSTRLNQYSQTEYFLLVKIYISLSGFEARIYLLRTRFSFLMSLAQLLAQEQDIPNCTACSPPNPNRMSVAKVEYFYCVDLVKFFVVTNESVPVDRTLQLGL